MRRQSTDPDAVGELDSLQFIDPPDIDQQRRRCQPQFQCRDQRMATGHELAAIGVLLQQGDSLGKRCGANVVE